MKSNFQRIFISLFLALPLGLLTFGAPVAEAAPCSPLLNFAAPAPGTVVGGVVMLVASQPISGTTPLPVSFAIISPTTASLGTGTLTAAGQWSLQWNTLALANGNYSVQAFQPTPMAGTQCTSNAIPITIANPISTVPTPSPTAISLPSTLILQVSLNPATWSGDTNVNTLFVAHAQYGTTDVTASTQFTWATTLGVLQPNGSHANFNSGPQGGIGEVKLRGAYSAQVAYKTAGVQVHSLAATTTTAPGATPTPQVGETRQDAQISPLAAATPISQPLNAAVETCLEKVIATPRIADIIGGTSKPTSTERKQARACFGQQTSIPARLAPVEPEAVVKLPLAAPEDVAPASASNVQARNSQGKLANVIKFKGRALPGANVFIYVFSEPLVLSAKANDQGSWDYQLDNPLKPGKHEVYVVFEKTAGNFVRSSVLPVSVAQAASGPENPQGNSLQLAGNDDAQLVAFLLSAFLVLLMGIRLFVIIRRRFIKHSADLATPVNGH